MQIRSGLKFQNSAHTQKKQNTNIKMKKKLSQEMCIIWSAGQNI